MALTSIQIIITKEFKKIPLLRGTLDAAPRNYLFVLEKFPSQF